MKEETTTSYRALRRITFAMALAATFAAGLGIAAANRVQGHVVGGVADAQPIGSLTDKLRVATVCGYHDGFERGTADRAAGKSSKYRSDDAYRKGTGCYDPNWDVERAYQATYRKAYGGAYEDGFRGRDRDRVTEDEYKQYPAQRPTDGPSGTGAPSTERKE
jgi:hypothetical protein